MRVSCLMVTMPRPERRAMMRRAIEAYLAQTHGDRELVVVVDRGVERDACVAAIAAYGRDDIVVHLPEGDLPIGALRNAGIAHAHGDLLCQWDDDDLHHPERISGQMAALAASGGDGVVMRDVLMLDAANGALRWLNWAATPVGGHPATLLCPRDRAPAYPETGPDSRLGEDVAALTPMRGSGVLHAQEGDPHLYVYVSHGANISGSPHHAMLAETLAISTGLLRRREGVLRDGLAAFGFAEGSISVCGPGGEAFRI